MSPFLSDRTHKTLTALNSDFLFLAVSGEHCMIKHNVCVCVCFLIKKSKFFVVEMQSLAKRYETARISWRLGEAGRMEGKLKAL